MIMRFEAPISSKNWIGMISSFRACHGRSTHLAKDALMRLQVRHSSIATNGAHQEKQIPFLKVRYTGPGVYHTSSSSRKTALGRNLPQQVSSSVVSLNLAKALERGRMMHQEIEDSLASLIKNPTTSNSGYLDNMRKADRWLLVVQDQTRRLMASQRQCMELCAVQIVLNIIWSKPAVPNRIGLSLNLLTITIPSVRGELGWAERRKQLVWHIGRARRYIPHYKSLSQLESSSKHRELGSRRKPAYYFPYDHFYPALDRALVLVLAADRLFIAMRLMVAFRRLMRLTDEMVLVVKQLELVNERI